MANKNENINRDKDTKSLADRMLATMLSDPASGNILLSNAERLFCCSPQRSPLRLSVARLTLEIITNSESGAKISADIKLAIAGYMAWNLPVTSKESIVFSNFILEFLRNKKESGSANPEARASQSGIILFRNRHDHKFQKEALHQFSIEIIALLRANHLQAAAVMELVIGCAEKVRGFSRLDILQELQTRIITGKKSHLWLVAKNSLDAPFSPAI